MEILSTKLYIPPHRPKFVIRHRLMERLNEGMQRKLTLISAPAGFGKTTLVSEWVAERRLAAAWISLDEGHNNPTRFLEYLVAALRKISAMIGEGVLGMLQSRPQPANETILTALINDITIISGNFVLVLDDYHILNAKPIDDILTFLINHLPPQMHIYITTREDPHLPLARLRTRGQLSELRDRDLRFTPSEASEFLNKTMGLNLSAKEVAALENRTEGWIAGLQLAGISMQGRTDTGGFIQSFTGNHHFVMDYLIEEVLHQQPKDVQTFLLQTSLLDRLSGSLCEAVVGPPSISGQETLEYLVRANLLIVPLDDHRQWYRYHHLFAEVLKARLTEQSPDQIAALHLRACEWYDKNNLPSDAIRHALAAKDFEKAAGLIERAYPSMDQNLRSATWLVWVKALPEEIIRSRPLLCAGYGWALLDGGELEACEVRLQAAEQWLEKINALGERPSDMIVVDEDQFRALPLTLALARTYQIQALGDIPGTVRHARRALGLIPPEDHYNRGMITLLLGLSYWAGGDLESADQALFDGVAGVKTRGNILIEIAPTFVLADIKVILGRLCEAINLYEKSLQLALKHGDVLIPGMADLYFGLAKIHHEQGNTEVTEQYLRKCEELGEQAWLPDWQYRWCVGKAQIMESRGDLDEALNLLIESEGLYKRTPLPNLRPVATLKARVWVRQGRLREAMRWVRDQKLSVEDDLSYLREYEYITLSRALIARYKNNQVASYIQGALDMIERLLKAAEEGKRTGDVIEILILQALAHEARKDNKSALASLKRALSLAEPEGYVRIFVDEGAPMAALLSTAATQGIMPEYIGKLLSGFEKPCPSPIRTAQTLLELLSQREVEVLKLIAQGLSNQEICKRLFLALTTVKGHNRNIFDKLHVQRRTEAVARARELGLL